VAVLTCRAFAAPTQHQPEQRNSTTSIAYHAYSLPNGLRVLLAPDDRPDAPPVVTVHVTYDVGSRNERPGRSGFAHLFEHMMFQGSENVPRGRFTTLVTENGGNFNGNTSPDRTVYFETLPANQLALGLFLEADRMRALDVSQENLDNQRAVVQEEKRQSYDNRPYGHVTEALFGQAYQQFPYQHTTIGSMADLDAATLADVRAFHDLYYVPNNAVLTVAGRFDIADARALIAHYFEPIARRPQPPAVADDEPFVYPGERRRTLPDPLARQPRYDVGYLTVAGNDPDFFPLVLLGDILCAGRTSRLYHALVETDHATRVAGGPYEQRGPGMFAITVSLPADGDVAVVERTVNAEIARVQHDGVTADEIATALAGERMQELREIQTTRGRANRLGTDEVFYHDPGRIETFLPRLHAVTAAQIQQAAARYLVPANRTTVITQPAGSGGPAPAAAPGAAASESGGTVQ
jgi:predicted Zn-dependent peptidase